MAVRARRADTADNRQFRQLRPDCAIVDDILTGARAALKREASAWTEVEGDIDSVEVTRVGPIVARQGGEVVHGSGRRARVPLVQPGDHLTAPAGPPRIGRGRDAEAPEISRGDRPVVRHREALEPSTAI